MKEYISTSEDETFSIGEEFAKLIQPGDILCLYGDLGSGKTTFSKGLAKGLGIHSRIISPTFVLVRTHLFSNTHNPEEELQLYHLDLYRLEDEDSLQEIGFDQMVNDKKGVTLIEWSEKLRKYLPTKRYDIRFVYISDKERKITIQKYE